MDQPLGQGLYLVSHPIHKYIVYEKLLYVTGTEALVVSDDSVNSYCVSSSLEEQIEVVFKKINRSIIELDYMMDDIFLLNVYLRSDIAYQTAIELIKQEIAKYTNNTLTINCNVNITYCDGMAVDDILIEIDGFVKSNHSISDVPIGYACFQLNLDLYDSFNHAKNHLDSLLKENLSPSIRITTKYVKSKNSSEVYIDIIHDELMMKLNNANVDNYIIETLPVRKLMNNKSFLEINIHSF